MNNMMAGMLARNAADPIIRVKGLRGTEKQLVMFVSQHAHYSNKRTAMILGLGSENVISVPVQPDGKMDPVELHRGSNKCDGEREIVINQVTAKKHQKTITKNFFC